MTDEAIAIASQFLERFEGCHQHAYPDPLSPMGVKLGARGIDHAGKTGEIPAGVAMLSGAPWTIGFGATGLDENGQPIARGTKWTMQQCRDRLAQDLQRFRKLVLSIYPGAEHLRPKALAALISLVYNRGGSLEQRPNDALDRRREMRLLQPAVLKADYDQMGRLMQSMKRIWRGQKNAAGLLSRRDAEAELCFAAGREATASGEVIA